MARDWLDALQVNPFLGAVADKTTPVYSPTQRIARSAVRGATLGYAGSDIHAETWPEVGAEFLGSIPPVAAVSMAAGPVVGAGARLARLAPLGKVSKTVASTLLADAAVAGLETGSHGSPFEQNMLWNMAASGVSAAVMDRKHILAKLRGVKHEPLPPAVEPRPSVAPPVEPPATPRRALEPTLKEETLDDVLKATTTQVPDKPPLPKSDPLNETPSLGPAIAQFGPDISRQNKPAPSQRVPFSEYVDHFDDYGQPIPKDLPDVPVTKQLESNPNQRLGVEVLTPKTAEADQIMKNLYEDPVPRRVEPQLDHAQKEFLTKPESKELRKQLSETSVEQEFLKTSELLNHSEEEVDRLLDVRPPSKVVDLIHFEKTNPGIRVEQLAAKNNKTISEMSDIVREAHANLALRNPVGEKEYALGLKMEIQRILLERCK